ncbi:MAG: FlgD immunoglobulin-like domain containing protein [bacterium]
MKKVRTIIFFLLISIIINNHIVFGVPSSSADRIMVDGISANDNVVLTSRNPIFSWDFTFDEGRDQHYVEILIGLTLGDSDIWNFESVLLVHYKIYDGGKTLTPDTPYYWSLRIRDDEGFYSDWVLSSFSTVNAGVILSSSQADLKIDWNNPFNPAQGQITKIRYQLVNWNENVAVRIYTINGELVKTLANHLAQQNALYTVEWDGENAENRIVSSGIYLVNLKAGMSISENRRIAVIK